MTKKIMLLNMLEYLQNQTRFKNINIDDFLKRAIKKNKKEIQQIYNLYIMGYYRNFESKLYNDILL